ncbi:MAG: hypothetical protein IPM33_04575 [Phycisphaerales bacterium]|nr:hypothetical protein [Phycisphaerales bacterium]
MLTLLGLCAPVLAQPLSTAFLYQGELSAGGTPAVTPHDLRFTLWTAPAAGSQIGPVLCIDNLTPTEGRFTSSLDFGAVFTGQRFYLQIDARADTGHSCANATGFTTLTPRQELTLTPNAAFALSAGSATQLNGQPASFFTDATNLAAGTLPDARLSANVANLNASQTFSGVKTFSAIPSFRGGSSGSTPPFIVDSTFKVSNLNADLLDGLDSSAFAAAAHAHPMIDLIGILPISQGGTGASSASAALTSLGAANLVANNQFVGSNNTFGGTVTAATFALSTPATRYRSLYHPAFQPTSSSVVLSGTSNFLAVSGTGTVVFQADLDIPHGAVITEVRFQVYDEDPARDITCSMLNYLGGFAPSVIANASVSSSGANNVSVQELVCTPTYTYLASSRSLFLRVSWDAAAGNSIRVYGARVTYTVTNPYP